MICRVCKKNESINALTVCSDRCNNIGLEILRLSNKYAPTNGCDNCWGDLNVGCSQKCKAEFTLSAEFTNDLYELVNISFNHE